MYLQNPQSFVVGSLYSPSEDGFEMNFQFFSSLIFAQFSINILIGRWHFPILGPTPIHAPRPRPITYSVGIGTSDYPADSADASTQEGPPPLELSPFLQDLLPGAVRSPVARASVSVLSPNFLRYLDTSATPRSPPPAPRITVSCGTSTRDEVQLVDASTDVVVVVTADKSVQAVVEYCDVGTRDEVQLVDASTDAVVVTADKSVQAVVEYCDVGTEHDRLGVTSPVLPPADSVGLVADPPEDLSVVGSLGAGSSPETVVPEPDSVPLVTSPMGTSLVDSDDEAIAIRLPGYPNSFKTCEVSDRQLFICFSLSIPSNFLLFSLANSDFLVSHPFFIV